MSTIAQETTYQIALRNHSKEIEGKSVLYMILVKEVHAVRCTFWQRLAASHEEQMSPLMILVLSRYEEMQELGSKNLSWKYLVLKKVCSASFSQSTECLIPDLHPEILPGCVEGQWLQWFVTVYVEADGKCQFLVGRVFEYWVFKDLILNLTFKGSIFHVSLVERNPCFAKELSLIFCWLGMLK